MFESDNDPHITRDTNSDSNIIMGNAAYKMVATEDQDTQCVHFKNVNETKLMISARQSYGTVLNIGDQTFDEDSDLNARVYHENSCQDATFEKIKLLYLILS